MNRNTFSGAGAASQQLTLVYFELKNGQAVSVGVAGSFNDWNADAGAMTREYREDWARMIALSPGTYEYCLVVDGQWMLDPQNQGSVANPFGTRNSVFTVVASEHEAHMWEAESKSISHVREDQREQLNKRAAWLCEEFGVVKSANTTVGRTGLGPRSE